jgi:hypothetical protein
MHASYERLATDNDSLPAVIELAERSPLFEPPWALGPLGADAHVPYGFPDGRRLIEMMIGILANKDDWALRCGTQLSH